MKAQKGLTLLETSVAIGFLTLGVMSATMLWSNQQKDSREDDLVYKLAVEQYAFAKALDRYVSAEKGNVLPETITVQDLKDAGYMSDQDYKGIKINDGVDVLGATLKGKIASPYGFTQTVGVFQTSDINLETARYYNLVNDDGSINDVLLENVYYKTTKAIAEIEKTYTPSVITQDGSDNLLNFAYSSSTDSLYDYYEKSQIENRDDITLATFTTIQKNPGYWVLRYDLYYPSHMYGGPTGQYQSMKSLGYSSYCPSPGNAVDRDTWAGGSEYYVDVGSVPGYIHMYGSWTTIGEMLGFQYVCLPASKAIVPEAEKSYSVNYSTYGTKTLNCTDSYRISQGYLNQRIYSTVTAYNISIGDLKYALLFKGNSYKINCNAVGSGKVYMDGRLYRGHFPSKINVNEDNLYGDRITNVPVNTLKLR